jgi:hypothetical protein
MGTGSPDKGKGMGRTSLSKMMPCYSCQACGKVAPPEYDPREEEFDHWGWNLQNIMLGDSILVVLTCPRCSHFEAPWILDQYRTRIREGHEIGFH